ncbi:MAG TPA: hypothetical protein VL614_15185 [Acetobacteraceae bacterium]|jgi:hypothetical protein|nr:hypothetical protein [Acetobacteraceae bacterium]
MKEPIDIPLTRREIDALTRAITKALVNAPKSDVRPLRAVLNKLDASGG